MLESWRSWKSNIFAGSSKFLQSWWLHRNIFEFEDAYINNKSHSNIEVYSTFNLIYNNVIYSKNEEYPKLERKVKVENCKLKSEEDNINNVIYNNDTSNYKDITYNKKYETIKLFDKFDEYIISIGKDIIRNYLLKIVVYKFKKKIYRSSN